MNNDFDLTNTIVYEKDEGTIYFCADDLYGHYTMPEMFDIVRAMLSRLEFIIEEMKGKK